MLSLTEHAAEIQTTKRKIEKGYKYITTPNAPKGGGVTTAQEHNK